MSTTSIEETAIATSVAGVKTFRGRTLEELLPQIREQLGPDAVVIRQRDGLMGGVGGFFQQRFVEVEARAGHPRVDLYDEAPEDDEPLPTPESFATLLAGAESEADPIVTAAAFAPPVGDSMPPALPEPEPAEGGPRFVVAPTDPDPHSSSEPAIPAPPEPAPTPEPAPLAAHPATSAPELTNELTAIGMSATFAERLIHDAEAHELPFTNGDLREATRRALARRLPTSMPYRAGGLAVAFAGPGSTGCASALTAAYKRAGRDARTVATLDQARARVERAALDAVLAIDLPPIPSDPAEVAALAERVAAIELDELLMVLPVDLDLPSLRALHERLAPLAPTALALACDQPRPQLGAPLELACATRLPLAYAFDGIAISPAHPQALAERLLP
jgi:Meckel syndrome type 1 protein